MQADDLKQVNVISEFNSSVVSQNNLDQLSWMPSYNASRCNRLDGAVQYRARLLILRLNFFKPTVLSSPIPVSATHYPNSPCHEFVTNARSAVA